MKTKSMIRENAVDFVLFFAAALLAGGYFLSGSSIAGAAWYVAGFLLLFALMFLKSVFGCSGPAAVVSEWIGRLSEDESVDLRHSVDVAGRSKLGSVAKALNSFVQAMRVHILRIIRGLHKFTFDFYRLERQLGDFFEAFAVMSGRVKEGIASGQTVSNATETQYASSEEISATAQGLARLAAELNSVVSTVGSRADAGNERLHEMERLFASVVEETKTLSEEARILSGKVDVIQGVVRTITGIAEQTNLLALNASIEAARAGEAGRGFAVVADEVRTLAEESKTAASRISESLQDLVSGVRKTSGGVESVAARMNEANENIRTVLAEIGAVLQGIADIGDSSERVAASAEELGASSEELAASAETVTRETERMSGVFDAIEERITALSFTSEGLNGTAREGAIDASALIEQLAFMKVMKADDFADVAEDAIKAHKGWVANLKKFVEGGRWDLETNPARCRFGIFLSFIERPEGTPDDLWSGILSMHEELHGLGHKVQEAVERGDSGKAREIFQRTEALSGRLTASLLQVVELCRSRGEQERSELPALPQPAR